MTEGGFRVIPAYSDAHNRRRLRKFIERLKRTPEMRRSLLRIRMLIRRRAMGGAKEKAPHQAQQPGRGRATGNRPGAKHNRPPKSCKNLARLNA